MRRLTLLTILMAVASTAMLRRVPLLAVPAYESGLVVGGLAAILLFAVASSRAARRETTHGVQWGLLATSPLDQVLDELRLSLRAGAALVGLPLFLLLTQAARSDCRVLPGLPGFLLVAVPAAIGGAAAGILAGSVARRPWVRALLLAGIIGGCLVADAAEGLLGPRVFIHDLFLGCVHPTSAAGYDESLDLPPTALPHAAWALLIFTALLLAAALVRVRHDAPPRAPGEEDVEGRDAWEDSRRSDAARARFLLAHHAAGVRRALVVVALLGLPFVILSDATCFTSGRRSLRRELSAFAQTEHFRLHYAPGSATEAHLPRLAVQLETAWAALAEWTGHEPTRPVDAWLHPESGTMFRLTGARGFLFAKPWLHELHVIGDGRRVHALRHELAHVMLADSGAWPLRVSFSPGMTEGLATALDEGFTRDAQAHEQVAAAARAGHVPKARDLLSPLGFFSLHGDRSYRASASFIGWLALERGMAPVLAAYPRGDVARTAGDLDALDAGWREFLAAHVPPPAQEAIGRERFDPGREPVFYGTRCARLGDASSPTPRERADVLAEEGLPDLAADAWCETPGWAADPAVLEAAARERLRAGRLEPALDLAQAALRRLDAGSARRDPLFKLRVRLLAGLSRLDEAHAALDEWRASGLAAWPDEVALEQRALDEADPILRTSYYSAVLAPSPDDTNRLAALVEGAPGFAPALHVLLGRQPAGAAASPERRALVLRLAELQPGSLAGWHLLEAARHESDGLRWEGAWLLADRALAMPGLMASQRREAEDLRRIAATAPGVVVWDAAGLARRPRPPSKAPAPPTPPAGSGGAAPPPRS